MQWKGMMMPVATMPDANVGDDPMGATLRRPAVETEAVWNE